MQVEIKRQRTISGEYLKCCMAYPGVRVKLRVGVAQCGVRVTLTIFRESLILLQGVAWSARNVANECCAVRSARNTSDCIVYCLLCLYVYKEVYIYISSFAVVSSFR